MSGKSGQLRQSLSNPRLALPMPVGSLAIRTLAAEATSGITVVSGLVSVLSMLLMSYLVDDYLDLPGGGNTLNQPLSLCYLVAPLLGGLAAARAGRLKAQGALLLAATTPGGRMQVLAVVAVAFTGWGMVTYLCGALVAGVSIGVRGPWTSNMVLLVLDAFALVLLLVVLGVAIGSRISNVLAGPVYTIVAMVALGVLDVVPDPVGRFSPIFADKFYPYGYEPNGALLIGLVVVMVGAVVVLVGQGFHSSVAVRFLSGVVAALLLTSGGLRVLTASAEPVIPRTNGTGKCGTSKGVELCVWPGPGVRFDSDLATLVQVRGVAARVLDAPSAFHEKGLHTATSPSVVIGYAPTLPNQSYVVIAGQAMVPQPCSSATSRDRDELVGLFGKLISPKSSPPPPYAAGAAVARRSTAEQRAWVATRLAALRACG